MAAFVALHHGALIGDHVADRYGNDPWVWTIPFVWSHCHARPRNKEFGNATIGSCVHGKDAMFFLTFLPDGGLVCDCVLVIAEVLPIKVVEQRYLPTHPIRHYHFDQERNPYHEKSALTRLADAKLSFVPHPPAPIDTWIENYIEKREKPLHEYFSDKRIKNVRKVTDAQGLYDRIVCWCDSSGSQRLTNLPLQTLKEIHLKYPAPDPLSWD